MDDGLAYSRERAGGEDEDGEQLPSTNKSPSGKSSRSGAADGDAGHKRSLSGGLLSRLSFLSPAPGHGPGAAVERAPESNEDEAEGRGDTMAGGWQQPQRKSRRRKGSLRKTALLGPGKMRLEGREWRERIESTRPSYGAQRQHQEQQPHSKLSGAGGDRSGGQADRDSLPPVETTPTQNSFRHDAVSSSSSSSGPWPLRIKTSGNSNYANGKPLSSTNDQSNNTANNNFSSPPSTATSPTPADTSTTDDEDILTFPRHPPPSTPVALLPAPPGRKSSFGDGGNGTIPGLSRRKSGNAPGAKNKDNNTNTTLPTVTTPPAASGTAASPPSSTSPSTPLIPPLTITPPPPTPGTASEWDYTETAWWGWVVLTATWLVFVVGMGSCLGVWSWAWDVGETPYAPPELEDDPTLPITGYYPALMILTGVMAWVWVVVAWIGMKYFRHAKISGEDG
ncbi:MAG: hypothetical protein M1839_004101 [Geoglossum umbratile]|nr:MAG: hypothetical protein M1839_004101 [Geoglossum umbratile]